MWTFIGLALRFVISDNTVRAIAINLIRNLAAHKDIIPSVIDAIRDAMLVNTTNDSDKFAVARTDILTQFPYIAQRCGGQLGTGSFLCCQESRSQRSEFVMIFDLLSYIQDHGLVLTGFILALLVIAYIAWHYVYKWTTDMTELLGKWDMILALLQAEMVEEDGIHAKNAYILQKFREEFKLFEVNNMAITKNHIAATCPD